MQKLLLLETMWKWPGDLSKQMGVELTSFFHFYEQNYAKILILDMWPTLFGTVRNRSENGIYPQTWSFNWQNYDEPVAFVVPYFQTIPCGKHEKKQAFLFGTHIGNKQRISTNCMKSRNIFFTTFEDGPSWTIPGLSYTSHLRIQLTKKIQRCFSVSVSCRMSMCFPHVFVL